jgi:GntR family transcriptional repressor for pyruvate dehydrogenase complex
VSRLSRRAQHGPIATILRRFVADIVGGRLAPGHELPPQVELAAQLGIGKTTVSELLRELEDRGLVTIRHGRGVTVNGPERWNLLDREVLGALLEGPRRASILRDFVRSLRLLEGRAAELAAERADAEDLGQLEASLRRMGEAAARAGDEPQAEDELVAATVAFHRDVLTASKNAMLATIMSRSEQAMLQATRALVGPRDARAQAVAEHAALYEAIAARDAAAARAAVERRTATLEQLLGGDALAAASS